MKANKLLHLISEAFETPAQVVLLTKTAGVSGEKYIATILTNAGGEKVKFNKKLVINFSDAAKSSLDQAREYVKSVVYNKYFVVIDGETAYFRKIKKGSVVRAVQNGFEDEINVVEQWFNNPDKFEIIPTGINNKIDQIGAEFNSVTVEERDRNELFKEQSRFFT